MYTIFVGNLKRLSEDLVAEGSMLHDCKYVLFGVHRHSKAFFISHYVFRFTYAIRSCCCV